MDFKIEFKTFRFHTVIIEAKNEEDARRIFNEKYHELEIDDGLGDEYSEITNVEKIFDSMECEPGKHQWKMTPAKKGKTCTVCGKEIL